MPPFNWRCPYCNHPQTVTDSSYAEQNYFLSHDRNMLGKFCIAVAAIYCSNPDCLEVTISARLTRFKYLHGNIEYLTEGIINWSLRPESSARPQPDYIPKQIRENYYQACRIRDLSPWASATMSRRCLQGMIRDFCGVTKPTLAGAIDRLDELIAKGKVPPGVHADTVDAIDAVRKVGNIGAHMEKDVDLIVEVEPSEAQALTGLIELLLDDWYVAKNAREEKIARVTAIGNDKDQIRKGNEDGGENDPAATEAPE